MRFLICLGFLIHSLSVFGQSEYYHFSKLNTHNGLSHNQVNAILKDSQGFLWFGTMSGLDRYDGYSFKIYRRNPNDSSSLIDNYILSLFELPNEKMLVRTSSG
ncbi:MAG TPA: two-component regulator propeller domain-containing protein, partial [Hanamia sp.]